jgi:hypothetical protein
VAAITRANNRNPASSREMKLEKMHWSRIQNFRTKAAN